MRLFEDFLDIEPIENNISTDVPKINIRSGEGEPSLDRHEYLMAVNIETTKIISMALVQLEKYMQRCRSQIFMLLSRTPEISSYSGVTFATNNTYMLAQFRDVFSQTTHFGEMGVTLNFSFDASWKKTEHIVRFMSTLYSAVMDAKGKEDNYMCITYIKNRAGDEVIVSHSQYYYMYTHERLPYFLGKRDAFTEFFRIPFFFIPKVETYYDVESMLGKTNDEENIAWLLRRLAGSDDSRPKKIALRKNIEKIINENTVVSCPEPFNSNDVSISYYLHDSRCEPSANFCKTLRNKNLNDCEEFQQLISTHPEIKNRWIMKMTNNRHNIHFIAALGPIISDHIVYNSLVAVSSTTKTLQQIKTFVETINTLIDTKLPVENTSEIIFASIRK